MIELCDTCEYNILIAGLIATLMQRDKDGLLFTLKIWYQGRELPFLFESHCHFEFLQEGLRVDSGKEIFYLWYDTIDCFKVEKE